MELHSLGKWLVGVGILIVCIGLAFQVMPRIPYLGRLPGDLLIKRDHFTFYFPLTTCILISLLLMLLSRFIGRK